MRGELVRHRCAAWPARPRRSRRSTRHRRSSAPRRKADRSGRWARTSCSRTRPATTCSIAMIADQHHLQREPLRERGLQEDQRRAAADGDEGGGRGQLHVDEPGYPVQSVEIRSRRERPALPEQKGQREQPARPDRDRGQDGRTSGRSSQGRLGGPQAGPGEPKTDAEIGQHRRHPHQQPGELLVGERA